MKKQHAKLVSLLLIVMMVLSTTVSGFADELPAEEAGEQKAAEKVEEKKEPEQKEQKEEQPKEQPKQEAEQPAPAEPAPTPAPAEEVQEEQAAEPEVQEAEAPAEATDSDSEETKKAKKKEFKLSALSDGTYKPDSFEFSGGTGKAKVTCDKVIIKDGKVTALFKASSENMTHFYMGTVSGIEEDPSLYDSSTGKCGKDVYKITDKQAYVEAEINEEKPFAARTVAMTDPHWVQYKYTLKLSDSSEKISDDTTVPDTEEDTPSTTLSDGTYKPDAFSFTGGTGKAKVTCEKVIVKNGKATAVFTASSENMTHFYMGKAASDSEDKSLYDPSTDKCGTGVYKITNKIAYVPVALNAEKPFAGRTVAMSEPHWIQYQYKVTLSEKSEKISDDTTIPDDGSQSGDDNKDDEKKDDEDPSDTSTLKDGTYKVNATTDRKMFYLYPKEKDPAQVILVKKNGKMTATITLTGDGYDYIYVGTPAQAKKAGKSKWIKYKKVNGYYTFTIPVSALDKKITVTPHSSKYEKDGDPSTDPWRPDKWIKFYSKGAKKVKDGSSIDTKKKSKSDSGKTSGKQTKFKNDKKAAKESKYKDDSGKSTSAVNNSTSLKDGVYTPDRFNWSGGSGRLSYIRCNKITVRGGKAFATIEFGSSKYDSLKASGHVYSKGGGGNSTFTIPVKLNANNTIIGRTTAMSQPHWVKYRIFIYKKGAGAGKSNSNSEAGDDGHVTTTKKLSSKAPDLMGLEFKEEVKVENAEYFKIYKYEQGITLIEVDQASDTALYKEEKKTADKDKAKDDSAVSDEPAEEQTQGNIEYDEEGNPIARSQNEITDDLYHNNIVNYLIVPKDVEIPAGLDKDCIIIQQPVENGYVASDAVLENMEELGMLESVKTLGMEEDQVESDELKAAIKDEKVEALGSYDDPNYAKIIKAKTDLALFPDDVLPEEVKDKEDTEAKEESDAKKEALEVLQRRFSALAVPMLIDRSGDEKSNYGKAEWIKVYGQIFGEEEKAEQAFKKFTEENKEKKVKKVSDD